MSNNHRVVGHDTMAIKVPCLSTCEVGDLMYLNAGGLSAVPASEVVWSLLGVKDANETAAVNREKFLGVSLDQKIAAASGNILIATAGYAKFPHSGLTKAAQVGSWISPVSGAATASFSNQLILAGGTSTQSGSIGRLVEPIQAGLAANTLIRFAIQGVTTLDVSKL